MPYYNIKEVKASALTQQHEGPDPVASKILADFGFQPAIGLTTEDMNIGATPMENLIVRYNHGTVSFFQLFKVEKLVGTPRLVELDGGRVLSASTIGGHATIRILGNGRKLHKWEIELKHKPIPDPTAQG